MSAVAKQGSINFSVWLLIALPSFAVLASVGTAMIAFFSGDPTLPDEYHWEGMKLDYDFARAQRATDLDVRAMVRVPLSGEEGLCRVDLRLNAPLPQTLTLTLIHGAHPGLDQSVKLTRRDGASYEALCTPVPAAQWHVELSDQAAGWSVRRDSVGALGNVVISARSPVS